MKGSLAFIERNRILWRRTSFTTTESASFQEHAYIKGNARTYQFNFLNDILHESETSYKKFRDGDEDSPSQAQPLEELDGLRKLSASIKRSMRVSSKEQRLSPPESPSRWWMLSVDSQCVIRRWRLE